jgi:hypothetical protein
VQQAHVNDGSDLQGASTGSELGTLGNQHSTRLQRVPLRAAAALKARTAGEWAAAQHHGGLRSLFDPNERVLGGLLCLMSEHSAFEARKQPMVIADGASSFWVC